MNYENVSSEEEFESALRAWRQLALGLRLASAFRERLPYRNNTNVFTE